MNRFVGAEQIRFPLGTEGLRLSFRRGNASRMLVVELDQWTLVSGRRGYEALHLRTVS